MPLDVGSALCCQGQRAIDRRGCPFYGDQELKLDDEAKDSMRIREKYPRMKSKWELASVALLALMSASPAFGASWQIQAYCFEKAQQATLPFRRGAAEAFMANCIADLTPAPPMTRKYRTRPER
jgi:hypothetical protein